MVHVRLPPGFTPNASVLKPKQVHSAVYENGKLYCFTVKKVNIDFDFKYGKHIFISSYNTLKSFIYILLDFV